MLAVWVSRTPDKPVFRSFASAQDGKEEAPRASMADERAAAAALVPVAAWLPPPPRGGGGGQARSSPNWERVAMPGAADPSTSPAGTGTATRTRSESQRSDSSSHSKETRRSPSAGRKRRERSSSEHEASEEKPPGEWGPKPAVSEAPSKKSPFDVQEPAEETEAEEREVEKSRKREKKEKKKDKKRYKKHSSEERGRHEEERDSPPPRKLRLLWGLLTAEEVEHCTHMGPQWCPLYGTHMCRKSLKEPWAAVQHLQAKHGVEEEQAKAAARQLWKLDALGIRLRSRSELRDDRRPAEPKDPPRRSGQKPPSSKLQTVKEEPVEREPEAALPPKSGGQASMPQGVAATKSEAEDNNLKYQLLRDLFADVADRVLGGSSSSSTRL
ncbi:unnamed protein product [Symbiodinium sp. CCMP2592]|nr:unnamed protein product [Symbiodinium sp. CCMP2592]